MNIDLGQVYTPKNIAEYMVDLFGIKGKSCVLEPCFGEGIFLSVLQEKSTFDIYGIELDEKLYQNVKSDERYVSCKLFYGDFLSLDLNIEFDGVIMNPPYIRHEKINDLEPFGITKEILQSKEEYNVLAKTSNMYMYFVVRALHLLKDEGELIVIFPSTWLSSKNADGFKKAISKYAYIDKQILVKGAVFGQNVLVDVVILKVVKSKNNRQTEYLNIEYRDGKIYDSVCNQGQVGEKNHIKLKRYCSSRRGITTGYNKLFVTCYSESEKNSPYYQDILSSPKAIQGYSTKNATTDKLLVIDERYDELPQQLQDYLEKFKQEILAEGKPKTLVRQIEQDMEWYKIKPCNSVGIIFSYIIRENMKFIMNHDITNVRDNFYIIYPEIDEMILFGLLNNIYTYSRLEALGKMYGGGVLKLQKYDIEDLFVVDIDVIEEGDKQLIKKLAALLIETGDSKLIFNISRVISKYEDISLEQIIEKYNKQRENRLMKGEVDEA